MSIDIEDESELIKSDGQSEFISTSSYLSSDSAARCARKVLDHRLLNSIDERLHLGLYEGFGSKSKKVVSSRSTLGVIADRRTNGCALCGTYIQDRVKRVALLRMVHALHPQAVQLDIDALVGIAARSRIHLLRDVSERAAH